MNRFAAALLFWLMMISGGTILAAAGLLPAWLEYDAARARHQAALAREHELELKQQIQTNQIEHLKHDSAYIDRLARSELGLSNPQVQTIVLLPPATDEIVRAPQTQPVAVDELALTARVRQTLSEYPVLSPLLLGRFRPVLIALSAGLVLAALLLLSRQRPVPRATKR